jgi:hypothetical protein
MTVFKLETLVGKAFRQKKSTCYQNNTLFLTNSLDMSMFQLLDL